MPARDGTGPWGQGPMTGRRRGVWGAGAGPGQLGFGYGRGMNFGRGGGFRGCRWPGGRWQTPYNGINIPGQSRPGREVPAAEGASTVEDSLDELKRYAGNLEEALATVRSRMAEIEKQITQNRRVHRLSQQKGQLTEPPLLKVIGKGELRGEDFSPDHAQLARICRKRLSRPGAD